jgi:hypothetical protein
MDKIHPTNRLLCLVFTSDSALVRSENKKNAKSILDNRMAEKCDEKQPMAGRRIKVGREIAAQFEGQNPLNPGHRGLGWDFSR